MRGRSGMDEDGVEKERHVALKHLTTSASRSFEVRKIGVHIFWRGEAKSVKKLPLG